MPDRRKSTLPDLSRPTETARRALYDAIEAMVFHRDRIDPESDPLPYTAEDAELAVFYRFGRWFAVWTQCEVPTFNPEAFRVAMVRIKADGTAPQGVRLYEV